MQVVGLIGAAGARLGDCDGSGVQFRVYPPRCVLTVASLMNSARKIAVPARVGAGKFVSGESGYQIWSDTSVRR